MGTYARRLINLCIAAFLLINMQTSTCDHDIFNVTENFGKWKLNFNGSEIEGYTKSASHSDSDSGRVRISTDTLIMTSAVEKGKTMKITVMKFSPRGISLFNPSRLMILANETLSKSGVCGNIKASMRRIEGELGIFASGVKCLGGESVYVAVYPVDDHLDRLGSILGSNVLAVIFSTYDLNATERFIDSMEIEQAR